MSGRAILQGIDIDIRAREIVTLIGPNGAGKTTLVRVLLGLEPPDRGAIVRTPGSSSATCRNASRSTGQFR